MRTRLEDKLYKALLIAEEEAKGWFDECRGGQMDVEILQVFEDAKAEYEDRSPQEIKEEEESGLTLEELQRNHNIMMRRMIDKISGEEP